MNKNPNLPVNAIRTTQVREGDVIVRNGVVQSVTRVQWYGHNGIITTTVERVRVNAAGTMRLA